LNRHLMVHLAQYDLTLSQFDVLAHLLASPGITQQELADRLFVTKGNVCGLLDRMENCQLVERRDDPEDRRAHLLFLTDRGRERIEQVMPIHDRLVQEHMAALSREDQRALMSLLRSLDRSLEHHAH
jgi:MarR family transcriptional regulator, organic hydroperoxide resistance regulator